MFKWIYYGEFFVKLKFYGCFFDINFFGIWFFKFCFIYGGKEDFYIWCKVILLVVGIMIGNLVVDNYGLMEIKNYIMGEVCYIEFKV